MSLREKKKIIAALTAGINAFLETQEKERRLYKLEKVQPLLKMNLWGWDGRKEIMENKRIWQMRWIKK